MRIKSDVNLLRLDSKQRVCVCECVFVCMFLCVCVCVYMFVCLSVFARLCVFVCQCLYDCVRACTDVTYLLQLHESFVQLALSLHGFESQFLPT